MPSAPPVTAAFVSFTEVTDPAEHRAYNEWHQLDHLPEQYSLPAVRWGQRWVSTPACAAARAVDGPELAACHYLTLYLLADAAPDTVGSFVDLGRRLHEVGRFHRQRRALLAGPVDLVGAWAAPRVLVSPDVVPFRPHRAVFVAVTRGPAGPGLDGAALVGRPAVAGVWQFRALQDPDRRWRSEAGDLVVCYLDDDPLAVAPSLAGAVAEGGDVLFAGPFETISPWRWDWFDQEPPAT